MTLTAFILIISSIAMHSLWHFLCKSSGKSSMAFFALFSTSLFLTMLPLALLSGTLFQLPATVLGFALTASAFAALGDIGLMLAYKYSDISLAYPTARALPVFLTMLATMLFRWGNPLTHPAMAGMLVIFAGCLMMAFSNGSKQDTLRQKLASIRKGLIGISMAAVATTGYTIVDSFGVQAMREAFPDCSRLLASGTYSCIREFPVVIIMWLCVGLRQLQGRDKGVLRELAKVYHPYLAGVFAALAYVLILIAMNFVSNVSFVQAFRQLSLPLSALLGYLILKEKVTRLRWLGLLLIMTGLVLSLL
jgi:drug/metabolite transporter (DMT)-like permease